MENERQHWTSPFVAAVTWSNNKPLRNCLTKWTSLQRGHAQFASSELKVSPTLTSLARKSTHRALMTIISLPSTSVLVFFPWICLEIIPMKTIWSKNYMYFVAHNPQRFPLATTPFFRCEEWANWKRIVKESSANGALEYGSFKPLRSYRLVH